MQGLSDININNQGFEKNMSIFRWIDDLSGNNNNNGDNDAFEDNWLRKSIDIMFKKAKNIHDYNSGLSVEILTIIEMKGYILSQPGKFMRVRSLMGNFSRGNQKAQQRLLVQKEGMFVNCYYY